LRIERVACYHHPPKKTVIEMIYILGTYESPSFLSIIMISLSAHSFFLSFFPSFLPLYFWDSRYSQSNSGSSSSPSPFAMKLRKHLRNLRLENVTQLGNLDRVVDFRFGSGAYAHHIILELYAQGNILLTDGEYRILALLRTHKYEVTAAGGENDEDVGEGGGCGGGKNKKEEEDANANANAAATAMGGNGGKEEVKVRVGSVYPVTFATTLTDARGYPPSGGVVGPVDEGVVVATTSSTANNAGLLAMDASEAYGWAKAELMAVQKRASSAAAGGGGDDERNYATTGNNGGNGGGRGKTTTKGGGGKKKKKNATDDSLVLKALLLRPNSGVYHYGPSLIEHCALTAGIDPVMRLTFDNIDITLPEDSWTALITALRCEGARVIENLTLGEGGGYILYRPKAPPSDAAAVGDDDGKTTNDGSLLPPAMVANHNPHSDKTLLEFQPHLLYQHKDQPYLKYATFTAASDEFFSNLSSQRLGARADAAEAAARDRLARIQADQLRRVEGLVREQERWRDSARLVETHAEDVDRALGVINSALESGMDWDALEQLVTVEQGNDNPIALLIHKLILDKDQVVLALPDVDGWDDSHPDNTAPPIQHVTVSIKESAHGNARAMFASYRATRGKEEKTMEASATALKAAEAKARMQLAEAQKKKQQVQVLPQRKTYWFEKFAWFITSDNYLVLAGKDAQQNEQLVKRYLRPGDAYLHAEVHGAATCILRAKRRRRGDGKTQVVPLSDQSLREAGTFTICRSAAWSSKMVTSAYWVESHQVSKTAPTGEYLTVGSFMIRGRKNFLPPSNLEMGKLVKRDSCFR
jgi:predicted ribosome quality control (RQC) complex YloA/Tae2 family protein